MVLITLQFQCGTKIYINEIVPQEKNKFLCSKAFPYVIIIFPRAMLQKKKFSTQKNCF